MKKDVSLSTRSLARSVFLVLAALLSLHALAPGATSAQEPTAEELAKANNPLADIKAFNLQPYKGRLLVPGEEPLEGAMLVMAVGNNHLAGGGFDVAPKARMDDGLLDLAVVLHKEPMRLLQVAEELKTLGSPDNGGLDLTFAAATLESLGVADADLSTAAGAASAVIALESALVELDEQLQAAGSGLATVDRATTHLQVQRKQAEALARAKAAEEARKKAEKEAAAKAAEEARQDAEILEALRAAEEARLKAEALAKAAEEARRKADELAKAAA